MGLLKLDLNDGKHLQVKLENNSAQFHVYIMLDTDDNIYAFVLSEDDVEPIYIGATQSCSKN